MKEQNGPNDLRAIAHQAMIDRGLEPDFPPDAIQQLKASRVQHAKRTMPFATSAISSGARSTTIRR